MKQRHIIVNELADLLEKLALQTERVLSMDNPSRIDIDLAKDHLRKIYDYFDVLDSFSAHSSQETTREEQTIREPDSVNMSPEAEIFVPEVSEPVPEAENLETVSPLPEPDPILMPVAEEEPLTTLEVENHEPLSPLPESEPIVITVAKEKPANNHYEAADVQPSIEIPPTRLEVTPEPMRPVAKEEPEVVAAPQTTPTHPSSIHDRFSADIADRSIGARLQRSKVTDLRKAIGINDKFQFSRELFVGNILLYEETINRLNDASNIDQAKQVLDSLPLSRQWSMDDPIFILFMEYVERRHL